MKQTPIARYCFLACAAGASYSLIGIAYQWGRSQALTPMQVMAVGALLSAAFFFAKLLVQGLGQEQAATGRGRPWQASGRVWSLGIVSGLTQYAMLRLIALALNRGPLSPVWCAASLGFVPTILYATWRFREALGGRRLLAVMAAVGCVLLPEIVRPVGTGAVIQPLYPLILCLIALANSVQLIAIKHLGSVGAGPTASDMERYGTLFMFLSTVSLAVAAASDVSLTCGWAMPLHGLLGMGTVAGVGCILGISLISACASGPAALIFTYSGVSGILCAALTSVMFLGETAGMTWFITVGMSVLAILLGASSPAPKNARIKQGEPSHEHNHC